LLDELNHAACFGDITRKRLLTRYADELTFAGLDRVTNGLHVLETKMIWSTEPNTINLRRRYQFLD
jgi:hypothetical protein